MGITSGIARNDAVTPFATVPTERRVTPRPGHMQGAAYDIETGGGLGLGFRPEGAESPPRTKGVRHELLTQVALLSRVELPVLLLGGNRAEAGAVAHLLHKTSPRAGRIFAEVNCLGLHEADVGLELFGSESAITSGTKRIKAGRFERCHHGTVFLSEIVGLPNRWQARLVDLLDDKRLCRLGGNSWVNVDVRLILSTSMNVEWALAAGELRRDLYYRVQTLGID